MCQFYLLPPRAVLGRRLAATLGIALADSGEEAWRSFADSLMDAMVSMGIYAVYRDEMPPDEEPARALADGYGADVGDEVIEISGDAALTTRRWRIGGVKPFTSAVGQPMGATPVKSA
jgi:hypothetical protein